MNLFDRLVDQALQQSPALMTLRPVVEKELLHFDILHALGQAGLLRDLVFMGGTCLRVCYGSRRLSEDLDFYGGPDFVPERLAALPETLIKLAREKYGLPLTIRGPRQEHTNVRTWKITVQTRPERSDLPGQRIHLDICLLAARDPRPMMPRNTHGWATGGSGLILRAASREEIYADKVVALALRRNRIKYRDVWDIHWLRQQQTTLPLAWLDGKAADHGHSPSSFRRALAERIDRLATEATLQREAVRELSRFLMREDAALVEQPDFWAYWTDELRRELRSVLA